MFVRQTSAQVTGKWGASSPMSRGVSAKLTPTTETISQSQCVRRYMTIILRVGTLKLYQMARNPPPIVNDPDGWEVDMCVSGDGERGEPDDDADKVVLAPSGEAVLHV